MIHVQGRYHFLIAICACSTVQPVLIAIKCLIIANCEVFSVHNCYNRKKHYFYNSIIRACANYMYMQIQRCNARENTGTQLICYTLVLRYGCHLLFGVSLVCTPRQGRRSRSGRSGRRRTNVHAKMSK